MTKMILLDGEDGRPGNYYVSCRSGEKWSLLYGPFGRHREAIEALPAARRAAEVVRNIEAQGQARRPRRRRKK